jgi:dienelactone hydrolase
MGRIESNLLTIFVVLIGSAGMSTLSRAGVEDVYKSGWGPHAVEVINPLILAYAEQDKNLRVRVSYPADEGVYPVIVFSHGAFCSKDDYSLVTDHWASHGYVVFQPTHLDSKSLGKPDFRKMTAISFSRLDDLSFIVDSFDQIEEMVPDLAGRLDREKLSIAGHSMGAMTAATVAGMRRKHPDGSVLKGTDNRFDAVVLLSGPGPMPDTPDNAWDDLTMPIYVASGPNDQVNMAGPGAIWEWRITTFTDTPAGDKYALIMQKMTHPLGGFICGSVEPGQQLEPEALTLVNGTSTAFLDAYLKNDEAARTYLSDDNVNEASGGMAELRSR